MSAKKDRRKEYLEALQSSFQSCRPDTYAQRWKKIETLCTMALDHILSVAVSRARPKNDDEKWLLDFFEHWLKVTNNQLLRRDMEARTYAASTAGNLSDADKIRTIEMVFPSFSGSATAAGGETIES
jgi:hypothetical protein